MPTSDAQTAGRSSGPSSGASSVQAGGCRCGRVRYELEGELGPVFNCHCRSCRQQHGAPFVTIAAVPSAAFRWLPGCKATRWSSTPNEARARCFCGVCGSRICNDPGGQPVLYLVVTSLDDESRVKPWMHVNTESKAPWFTIQDGLPQFTALPTPEQWAALGRIRTPEEWAAFVRGGTR